MTAFPEIKNTGLAQLLVKDFYLLFRDQLVDEAVARIEAKEKLEDNKSSSKPTKKQLFIGGYLDKKMKNHGLPYGMEYICLLAKHREAAEKKWNAKTNKLIMATKTKLQPGDYVKTTFAHPYAPVTKFKITVLETIRGELHACGKNGCYPIRLLRKIKPLHQLAKVKRAAKKRSETNASDLKEHTIDGMLTKSYGKKGTKKRKAAETRISKKEKTLVSDNKTKSLSQYMDERYGKKGTKKRDVFDKELDNVAKKMKVKRKK